MRLGCRRALTLRGLIAPTNDKRIIYLQNISTAYTITLKHDNSNSAAANRFYLPNSSDVTVQPHGTAVLYYRQGTSRWYLLSKN